MQTAKISSALITIIVIFESFASRTIRLRSQAAIRSLKLSIACPGRGAL